MGVSVLPQLLPNVPPYQYPKRQDSENSDGTVSSIKPPAPGWHHRRRKRDKRRNRGDEKTAPSPSSTGSRSNMKVARSTEWQYADNMTITDIVDLGRLEDFIANKVNYKNKNVIIPGRVFFGTSISFSCHCHFYTNKDIDMRSFVMCSGHRVIFL